MLSANTLHLLLVLAGIGQLVLIVGSLAIPTVLKWREQMTDWPILLRQMFWNYAAYIWLTNLSFGLLSTFRPQWLLDGSPLGGVVAGFIFVYWGVRVLVQFFYFDISELPNDWFHTLARYALDALFITLTCIYGYIFVMQWLGHLPLK